MAQRATIIRLAGLAFCLLATSGGHGGEQGRSEPTSDFTLGPARDVSLIEDFTTARIAAWTPRHA